MTTVIGHRGAAGLLPENTLKGFRHAIRLGVDAVECDVHRTRDGGVVVMHDETVDRTTDGTGRIAEMDLAAIRELDAGQGQKVPTLEELLSAVRGQCDLLCELKADDVTGPAVEAVLAGGMADQVVFISFSMKRLAEVRRRAADLRIGAVFAFPRGEDIEKAAALGVDRIGVDYVNVSLAAVRRVRQTGAEVNAWTPNDPAEMQAMLALGVTQITTDRPDVLLDCLKRQHRH